MSQSQMDKKASPAHAALALRTKRQRKALSRVIGVSAFSGSFATVITLLVVAILSGGVLVPGWALVVGAILAGTLGGWLGSRMWTWARSSQDEPKKLE